MERSYDGSQLSRDEMHQLEVEQRALELEHLGDESPSGPLGPPEGMGSNEASVVSTGGQLPLGQGRPCHQIFVEIRPPRERELSDYKWFFHQTELARAVQEQSQQAAKEEGQQQQQQQQQQPHHTQQRAQRRPQPQPQPPQQPQPLPHAQQKVMACDGTEISAAVLSDFERLNRATREAHASKDYSAAADAYRALEAALGGNAGVVSAFQCHGVSQFYANHLRTWQPSTQSPEPKLPSLSPPQPPVPPASPPPAPPPQLDATSKEATTVPSLERFSSVSLQRGLLELYLATFDPQALGGGDGADVLHHVILANELLATGRFDEARVRLNEATRLARSARQSAQRLASQLAAAHHARWALMRLECAPQ